MRRLTRAAGARVHEPRLLRPWLAAALASFALLLLWQRAFRLAAVDDAYIFLRYARNCALGLGPVFNPGERVEGFTSPLWLAILVPGQLLAPGSSAAALILGGLCAALTIATVVSEALGSRVSPWLAWGAGAFLATSPGVVYWASSGMDTSLFALLACAALLRFGRDLERGRTSPATAVLLAGACLARMEGTLLVAIAAAFCWVNRRSLGWRWLILPVAVCTAGLVARRFYFGDWLPNTFYAKAAGPRALLLRNGLRYGWHLAGTYGPFLVAIIACAAPALRTAALRPWLPCLTLVPIWLAEVIWTGGDHFAMGRLVQPLVPILLFVALQAVNGEGARRPRAVPLGLLLLALTATSLLEWRREGPAARSEMDGATRWLELGRWLRSRVPDSDWIAAVPIGGIGFGSERRVLDLTGLTNPVIARTGLVDPDGAPGHLRYQSEYVLARAPALIFLNFGWSTPGRFLLFPGYNMAISDLLAREHTRSLYRMEAYQVAPGRFAHFLVRKDHPALSDAAGPPALLEGPAADPRVRYFSASVSSSRTSAGGIVPHASSAAWKPYRSKRPPSRRSASARIARISSLPTR